MGGSQVEEMAGKWPNTYEQNFITRDGWNQEF